MAKLKRAIFIAAGEGSRMRPVTLETPKPLVKVNGERIIETSINALRKNGIEEFYIVVGYKKEVFYEVFKNQKDVHIVENPYYLKGNNITSMYMVREYLPESFVLEADILVKNEKIFDSNIEKSGYFANPLEVVPEWRILVENNRITSCEVKGGKQGYRLWGISMWDKETGEQLAEEIRKKFEDEKVWNIYWDEIALFIKKEEFNIGIREINNDDLCEIDTVEELAQIDNFYKKYL